MLGISKACSRNHNKEEEKGCSNTAKSITF